MKQLGYDVISVNELPLHWLANGHLAYHTECGRAALIVLNEHLESTAIKVTDTLVTIQIKEPLIKITTAYLCPSLPDTQGPEIADFVNTLKQSKANHLIMGDVNGRSIELGDTRSNTRGNYLMQQVYAHDWRIINEKEVPTYTRKSNGNTYSSIIDWAIITKDLINKASFDIDDDHQLQFSDHMPVKVTINTDTPIKPSKSITILRYSKFLKATDKFTLSDVTQAHRKISMAVEQATQIVTTKPRPLHWDKQMILLDEKRKKYKNYINKKRKRLPLNHPDRINFRTFIREFNRISRIKEEKYNNESALQESLNTTYKRVWRPYMDTLRAKVTSIKHDGVWIHDTVKAAEIIINHIYPENKQPAFPLPRPLNELIDPPITDDEVDFAIRFANSNAAGPDGLKTKLIRVWYRRSPHFIRELFRHWHRNMAVPKEYKNSYLILIKKKVSLPPSVDNVRPIGLLDQLVRCFELIIKKRLQYYLSLSDFICSNQHGFSEGGTTLTALTELNRIRQENRSQTEAVVALDIAKAFDNINHEAIIKALGKAGIPHNLTALIGNYYLDRRVTITTPSGHKVTKPMYKGTVQGSVLSPILFNMAMAPWIRAFNENDFDDAKIIVYADDITLVVSKARARYEIIEKVQKYVEYINSLISTLGLHLSISKTKIIVRAAGNFNKDRLTTFHLNGAEITSVTNYTLLGLQITSANTYTDHLATKMRQAYFRLQALKEHFNRSSKMTIKRRIELIKTLIYPLFTYAAAVWFKETRKITKDKILSYAKEMTIAIFGSQCIKAPLISSHLFLNTDSLYAVCLKRKRIDTQKLAGKQSSTGRDLDQDYPKHLARHPAEYFYPKYSELTNLESIMSRHRIYITPIEVKVNQTKLLTVGIVHQKPNEYLTYYGARCDDTPSMYQMTQASAIIAVNYIKSLDNQQYTIISCNKGLVQSICKPDNTKHLTYVIRDEISQMVASRTNITLAYIQRKSMANVYNFAKAKAKALINMPVTVSNFAVTEYKLNQEAVASIKEHIKQEYADPNNSGSELRTFFPTMDDPMIKLAHFTQWSFPYYTGAGPFRTYINKVTSGLQSDKCPCTSERTHIQSVEHILVRCIQTKLLFGYQMTSCGLIPLLNQPWSVIARTPNIHRYIRKVAAPLFSHLMRMNTDAYGETGENAPVTTTANNPETDSSLPIHNDGDNDAQPSTSFATANTH